MQTWGTPQLVRIADTADARGGISSANEGIGEGGKQDKKRRDLP